MLDSYPFHNFSTLSVLNNVKKRFYYNASKDKIITVGEFNNLKKDITNHVFELGKMLKNKIDSLAKYRCNKTFNGFYVDVIKSALQKYVRRGIE